MKLPLRYEPDTYDDRAPVKIYDSSDRYVGTIETEADAQDLIERVNGTCDGADEAEDENVH